ncbi:MAG TPA: NAD(+)/NADH kinase [archaeon]|nr:NAD(+)/NADH kinase [archaeon]
MFHKAGIVARSDKLSALTLASKIDDYLKSKGLAVLLESDLASFKKEPKNSFNLSELYADLIIVVGGNGTVLRTCASLPNPETPILSVNMGTKGLLTEVSPRDVFKAIDNCLSGNYMTEDCIKISTTVNNVKLPDALNEVLITACPPLKMLHFNIEKDGAYFPEYRSDGIIISTPIGSTAHSFSAYGPILNPHVEAFVLTPICPLTHIHSVVFPSSSTLKIKLIKRESKATVIIDGVHRGDIATKDLLTIKKSKYRAVFVRFKNDFFKRRLEKIRIVS